MTYMKILLLLMFCTVLPMQAQQMKKLTGMNGFPKYTIFASHYKRINLYKV